MKFNMNIHDLSMMKHQKRALNVKNLQNGLVAISTILVISAIILSITATVALLSIGEAQSSFSLSKGEDTLAFVEGCTEDALLKARNNSAYNGGNITRPEGTCTVSISKVGNTWTMNVSTISTTYTRTIQAVITRNTSGTSLTSWKEI